VCVCVCCVCVDARAIFGGFGGFVVASLSTFDLGRNGLLDLLIISIC
jgi:hypothetical protein